MIANVRIAAAGLLPIGDIGAVASYSVRGMEAGGFRVDNQRFLVADSGGPDGSQL